MPFRDNPQDDAAYFARRDRGLMVRRGPEDDDEEDDIDIEDCEIGGEG